MLLAYRLPRLRNALIPILFAFTTLVVFAGQAHAANVDPVGIGDLLPSPDSKVPKGGETLYETYDNPHVWALDSDYGKTDILDPTVESIADVSMSLIAVLGQACIVIVRWIFNLTSVPPIEEAITKSIGGAAKGLTATLLPTALAVGGVVAFAQHKKGGGGGGLSQVAWVFISGIFSVSLLTTPQTWVDGVDSARQVGAGLTMNASAKGIGDGSGDFPFKLDHKPKYSGNGRDDMLRKSSDAVWRAYVATPWCVAEFGSFEVCKKYGKDVLDKGIDKGKRKEFLQNEVNNESVGGASVSWRQGHNPVGRIMVTIPALVSVVLFAALVLMLAFTSLASLLGALMLLCAGVLFACLWVIPGRPRQWGLAWFDQVLARTLESTIATLVLGCVLIIQTACTQMFSEYGWLPTTGLTIAAAVIAMKFRGIIAQIVGISGTSGGALGGYLAAKALGGLFGGKGRRKRKDDGHDFQPVKTKPRPASSSGGSGGRGGSGGSAPPPGGGADGDGAGATPRVGKRPPAPPPLPEPTSDEPNPALPAGAGRKAPTVTLERERTNMPEKRATVPPPRPRPTLPPGAGSSPGASGGGAADGPEHAGGAAGGRTTTITRPSPVLRPEQGRTPNYGFRQAPAPPTPGEPKRIQATVIRSTPNGPPGRRSAPARRQPPPPRTTAPSRRTGPGAGGRRGDA